MQEQPEVVPANIAIAIFMDTGQIEFRIRVSEKTGVKAYGFAFDGAPVPMSSGAGRFFAPADAEKLLEWTMLGEPGGTMKVVVTRGGAVVKQRDKSTIPPPGIKGYDAFRIKVS